MRAGRVLAFEFLIDSVDAREILAAEGVGYGGLVGWVDLERLGDAILCDFDRLGVLGCQRAVCE